MRYEVTSDQSSRFKLMDDSFSRRVASEVVDPRVGDK
jgi:hypothetical protein